MRRVTKNAKKRFLTRYWPAARHRLNGLDGCNCSNNLLNRIVQLIICLTSVKDEIPKNHYTNRSPTGLKERITSGLYKPGERIPAIRTITSQFGVNKANCSQGIRTT